MVNRRAFTLIEAVISIGVISIIIPIIFNLLFASLRSELRIKVLKTVKNNGDFALSFITNTIKENAYQVVDCASPNTVITVDKVNQTIACFRTKTGECFHVGIAGGVLKTGSIAGCSALLRANADLTNPTDITPSALNMTIDVPDVGSKNARFNTPVISLSFKVTSKKDTTTSLDYYSKVKIRNY